MQRGETNIARLAQAAAWDVDVVGSQYGDTDQISTGPAYDVGIDYLEESTKIEQRFAQALLVIYSGLESGTAASRSPNFTLLILKGASQRSAPTSQGESPLPRQQVQISRRSGLVQGRKDRCLTPTFLLVSDLGSGGPGQSSDTATDYLRLLTASSLEAAVELVDFLLSRDFGRRLRELIAVPFDEDDGEKPINTVSLRHMTQYFLATKQNKRPMITATPYGVLQADWRGPKGQRLSIRFRPDGKCLVVRNDSEAEGLFDVPLSILIGPESPVKIPEWARG